jgi:hypothetical protein
MSMVGTAETKQLQNFKQIGVSGSSSPPFISPFDNSIYIHQKNLKMAGRVTSRNGIRLKNIDFSVSNY